MNTVIRTAAKGSRPLYPAVLLLASLVIGFVVPTLALGAEVENQIGDLNRKPYRAFQLKDHPMTTPARPINRFPRHTVARLRALDQRQLKKALGRYLEKDQIRGLEQRRRKVLELVDAALAERGDEPRNAAPNGSAAYGKVSSDFGIYREGDAVLGAKDPRFWELPGTGKVGRPPSGGCPRWRRFPQ